MSSSEDSLKSCNWGQEKSSVNIIDSMEVTQDDTIVSLWRKSFKKRKKDAFMWDNIFGSQTKKDVILKAYVVSHYIKKIP